MQTWIVYWSKHRSVKVKPAFRGIPQQCFCSVRSRLVQKIVLCSECNRLSLNV